MKRYLSFFLLLLLVISNFQVGQIYAASTQTIQSARQESLESLGELESSIELSLKSIKQQSKDTQKIQKISEKQQELQEYFQRIESEISKEKNSKNLEKILEKAKKVGVLKVISSATEYTDVTQNIQPAFTKNAEKKSQAIQTLKKSLKQKSGNYSLIVKTHLDTKSLQEEFSLFDEAIGIKFLYSEAGKQYYSLSIPEDSIISQELLPEIESGILPESFRDVTMVLPEIYSIEEIDISGEDISKTWGVDQYAAHRYFPIISSSGEKIRVGVVDTGIDASHPDLSGNINLSLGKDFVNEDSDASDDQGHGTHVAGTIAASLNHAGIIGVNPYVELIPLKICNSSGFCPSYAILNALSYAQEQGIDILNMSLGGYGDPQNSALCDGISSVVSSGGIVVAASGNADVDTSRFVPGGCNDAITVGAVDTAGERASFSNYGSKVDVAAPGVNIYSTYPVEKGSYKLLSGTSMATPHIAGLVSIIQSYNPSITSSQVKALFSQYPQAVSSQEGKSIAAGVDIEALIIALQNQNSGSLEGDNGQQENQSHGEEQENTQSGENQGEKYEILLDGITYIDEPIEFIENQEAQDNQVQIANEQLVASVRDENTEISLSPAAIYLNLLGNSDIHISETDTNIEKGTLIPEVVSPILSGDEKTGAQVFNSSGELLSEVEINSAKNMSQVRVQGRAVGPDFDFQNLPFVSGPKIIQEGIDINNVEPELQFQELFIDGAEKGLEINSIDALSNGTELIFSSGTAVQETKKRDFLDVKVEKIPEYISTQELFIDGAKKTVSESSGKKKEKGEKIKFTDIPPSNTHSFSAGEKALTLVKEKVEVSEIIPYDQKEIFIDGAEKGSSINSEIQGEEIVLLSEEDILKLQQGDTFILEDDEEEEGNQEENLEIYEGELQQDNFDWPSPNLQNILGQGDIQTIETPEALLSNPDFQISEDYDPSNDELKQIDVETYTFTPDDGSMLNDGILGVQAIYSCSVEVGKKCSFSLSNASKYTVQTSDSFIADYWSGSSIFVVEARNPGSLTLKLYYNGSLYHTISVSVKSVTTYNVSVEEGKRVSYTLPNIYAPYRHDESPDAGRLQMNYSLKTKVADILGFTPGTVYVYMLDSDENVLYRLKVTITKRVPIVLNLNVYEGGIHKYTLAGAGNYNFTVPTNSNLSFSKGSDYISMLGHKAGTVQIMGYDRTYGIHSYTLNITVKTKPIPKEYSITLIKGETKKLYLPDQEKYSYSFMGGILNSTLYNSPGYVEIKGNIIGTGDYRLSGIEGELGGVTKYILHITVIPAPPPEIDVEVYQTKQAYKDISSASSYEYTVSQAGYVTISSSSSRVYFTGTKSGNVTVYAKQNGGIVYIFHIKVNPIPTPQEYSARLEEGKTMQVYLPQIFTTTINRTTTFGAPSLTAQAYQAENRVAITATNAGKMDLRLYDTYGFVRYIIHVDIYAKAPVVKQKQVYETREIYLNDTIDAKLVPSVSAAGYVQVFQSGDYVGLKGVKAGNIEVYLKDSYGNHRVTYQIKIIAKPVVTTYPLHFSYSVGSTHVYLPDVLSNYNITKEGQVQIFEQVIAYESSFYIDIEGVGNAQIVLRDKALNFERYIIDITSEPHYENYTINVTDYQEIYDNQNYSYALANSTIIGEAYDSGRYIYGKAPGTTKVDISKDNVVRQVLNFQVKPVPTPITVRCNTQVGEDCELRVKNGGYSYDTTLNLGHFSVDAWTDRFVFRAERSGEFTAYIESYYGNYVTHIFKIKVDPAPVEVVTCDVAVGGICDLGTMYTDDRQMTFQTTNEGLVYTLYTRSDGPGSDSEWKDHESGIYDHSYKNFEAGFNYKIHYELEALKVGKGEIYIFDAGDHLYTIKINAIEVQPIAVSQDLLKVKQAEVIETQILNGGGGYSKEGVYTSDGSETSIDYFIVNFDRDSEGFYLPTGKVKLKNTQIGHYYPTIQDRFNQRKELRLVVEDADLILGTYVPSDLKVGEKYLIPVYDRYERITKIEQTIGSEILSARVIRDTVDGQEYIEITALRAGKTTLKVTDAEGNIATIEVTIALTKDDCPDGDYTGDEYDGECGEAPVEEGKMDFGSLVLINDPSDINLQNILAFNIIGEYKEVGVIYRNELQEYERQIIEKNNEGFYILQLDVESCGTCVESFIPYAIDIDDNLFYPSSEERYVSFGEEIFQNIPLEGKSIAIASDQNFNIYINGYKEYWKQVELATTDVVVGAILGSAVAYGQISSYIGVLPHDLPISSYMLARFINGAGGYDYYGTNHWISKELQYTSWYQDRKNFFLNSIKNYGYLEIGQEVSLDFNIEKIYDSYNSKREQDFANSFGNIGWNLFIKKIDSNKFQMIIRIKDTYDFHKFKGSVFIGGNNMNGWAEYYQSRGYGGIYNWELEIIDSIN